MVPCLSLASNSIEGRISLHQRRVRPQRRRPRPESGSHNRRHRRANQVRLHGLISRRSDREMRNFSSPAVGPDCERVSFVSLARNIYRNTQSGHGKANGCPIRANLQTVTLLQRPAAKEGVTFSECLRGEAVAKENFFPTCRVPNKPPNKAMEPTIGASCFRRT